MLPLEITNFLTLKTQVHDHLSGIWGKEFLYYLGHTTGPLKSLLTQELVILIHCIPLPEISHLFSKIK